MSSIHTARTSSSIEPPLTQVDFSTVALSSLNVDAHYTEQETSDSEESSSDTSYKPEVPYIRGAKFTAIRHDPTEPFGLRYNTEPTAVRIDWNTIPQTEYCLTRRLIQGQMHHSETTSVRVTSVIRSEPEGRAQIVIVNDSMVAKI